MFFRSPEHQSIPTRLNIFFYSALLLTLLASCKTESDANTQVAVNPLKTEAPLTTPTPDMSVVTPASTVEVEGGKFIYFIDNYEQIIGREASKSVREKTQDLMPWLDTDFELNYMGPVGNSVDANRGGIILARDKKDRMYIVGEIIENPTGTGSVIKSIGSPLDVSTTADGRSIALNFFDPQTNTIHSLMTQDSNGAVKFISLNGEETLTKGVHLDVMPNGVQLASLKTDVPIFGFNVEKDIPFPVNIVNGIARYELDGEMWVNYKGKYIRVPMKEDGTPYDIWKNENNVIIVGDKSSNWTYLQSVEMSIVNTETGELDKTIAGFETPTIESLIKKGAKFRMNDYGLLLAYDPSTGLVLAEMINPDNWEWKYATDVENLDVPYVIKTSLDEWAGIDEDRIDFIKTLEELGYPKENVTCDEKGVCSDLEGNVIWKKGKFKLDFAKEAAIKYGNPKTTIYGPRKGNVPPGTQTDEVKKYVTLPLAQRFLKLLKTQNGGVDVVKLGQGSYREIMLDANNNSWGIILTLEKSNPDSKKYFLYENENKELVVVPID